MCLCDILASSSDLPIKVYVIFSNTLLSMQCYCRLLALVNPESIKSVANSYSETEEEKENR